MDQLGFDVKKLKRKDESEWTQVYDQCSEAVFSFLMRRNGNRKEVAKDLTQQAFLTAFQNIHNFDEDKANFLAWLFGIAKRDNYYFGHETKEMLSPHIEVSSDDRIDTDSTALSPRDEMARLQEDEFLEAILGTMPEQQEIALRLRYIEDLSHKEIGTRLEITEKAAEITVRRARQSLQDSFFNTYPFLTPRDQIPQESIG